MLQVLLKAGSFVFIIFLGWALKRLGLFGRDDYRIVMRIVLNITLPAAAIVGAASYEADRSLLFATLIGFLLNCVFLGIAFLLSRRETRAMRAVWLNSTPGYNIGCFALPFVQCFLTPASVVACCLFDAGNAIMCTGGTYALTNGTLGGEPMKLKDVGRRLLNSRPFVAYLLVLILVVSGIRIPQGIVTFLTPISNANAFLAMFMVGLMFDLSFPEGSVGGIVRIAAVRLLGGIAAALLCLFLLPGELARPLALASLAPISVASTAFSEQAGGDPAVCACANSLTIIGSLVTISCFILLSGL